MGFISDLASGGRTKQFVPRTPADRGPGRQMWDRVFGGVSKEDPRPKPNITPGGSYGRSFVGTEASYKRLLQAMRSLAPGGWSDDRWEQTIRHYQGISYTAITRLMWQMFQGEFQVFHKDPSHPDGKRPVIQGEPAYDLVELLSKPNNDDCFGDLMEAWCLQLNLTGMALTWMVPNALGQPYELYSIPTAIAVPQPAVNPDYPDGYYRIQPVYPYGPFSSYPTPASAVGAAIPAQWMLRIKFTHPLLRYDGFSPQTGLRLHIDEVESMDRSRWYSMKRSILPSAVLQMDEMEGAEPLPEEEIERIRAEIESQFQGDINHGHLLVAAPGTRLDQWGNRPVDMDYQGGWEQLVSFVMAGFGITKPTAGMIDDTSYSALFASLKQLYWMTLEPMCSRISSKLTRHLCPFFGNDLFIEIRCRRIDDPDVKNQKLSMLSGASAMTINELRLELEMPPTPEPWGGERVGLPAPEPIDPVTGMPLPQMPLQPQGVYPGLQTVANNPNEGMPDSLPGQTIATPVMNGMNGMAGTPPEIPGLAPSGLPQDPMSAMDALMNELAGGILPDKDDDGKGTPQIIANTIPKPGRLGRRAQGPRMGTAPYPGKSLYQEIREALTSGK